MKLFYLGIAIGITALVGSVFFSNTALHLEASSVFMTSKTSSTFSIEQTEEDRIARVTFLPDLFLSNSNTLPNIPDEMQKALQKQDRVLASINFFVTENIIANEFSLTNYIPPSSFTLFTSHFRLSPIILSSSLYTKGKFVFDISLGNLVENGFSPLYSPQKKLIIEESANSIAVIPFHAKRHIIEEIIPSLLSVPEKTLLIVVVDFDDQWNGEVQKMQKDLAKALIDNGADLVFGIGNSRVKPIEKYKNGYILYSLGAILPEKSSGIIVEIVLGEENAMFIHPIQKQNSTLSFVSSAELFVFFDTWNQFKSLSSRDFSQLLENKKIPLSP